jgi:hypothetical protein
MLVARLAAILWPWSRIRRFLNPLLSPYLPSLSVRHPRSHDFIRGLLELVMRSQSLTFQRLLLATDIVSKFHFR